MASADDFAMSDLETETEKFLNAAARKFRDNENENDEGDENANEDEYDFNLYEEEPEPEEKPNSLVPKETEASQSSITFGKLLHHNILFNSNPVVFV